MTRRTVGAIVFGLVTLVAASTWAQSSQNGKSEKLVFKGPTKQTLGQFDIVVPEGSAAEAEYQPDQNKLTIKTTAGETRIVTSARFLLLVENEEGTVEITLPTGRKINVEPGKSDIVGRALADDPGTISIRIASTVAVTVLEGDPAAATVPTDNTPDDSNTIAISPILPPGATGAQSLAIKPKR